MRMLFKLIKKLLILVCIAGVFCAYAIFIEPHLLTTEDVVVSSDYTDSKTGQTLTIAHFSDTHLGFHFDLTQLQKAVDEINAHHPDIIVFTGDLIDNAKTYTQIEQISPILAKLEAPLGKYAVYGNHDYGGGAERHYQQICTESGFHLLVNDVRKITLPNNKRIIIGGLDEAFLGSPDPAAVESQFSPVAVNILLLHEPDYIEQFHTKPQLALAGHSHGGQIQFPFFGPLITPIYAEKYTDGAYPLNHTLLYVNTGLGTTKLPVRFAVPPVITFYQLEL